MTIGRRLPGAPLRISARPTKLCALSLGLRLVCYTALRKASTLAARPNIKLFTPDVLKVRCANA
jgi:hypothetical protein